MTEFGGKLVISINMLFFHQNQRKQPYYATSIRLVILYHKNVQDGHALKLFQKCHILYGYLFYDMIYHFRITNR